MIKENLYVIKSVSDYLEVIKTLNEKENTLWFRGQSNANHRLVPSGLRDIVPIKDWMGNEITNGEYSRSDGDTMGGINLDNLLDEFKRRAVSFLDYTPKNDFEWLFIMQHHGVPTRLLDWTTNALVALYFAMPQSYSIENESELYETIEEEFLENGFSNNGAAIFVINPNKINEESAIVKVNGKITAINRPIDLTENAHQWNFYLKPMENEGAFTPICILSPHIDKRIRSQSGVFTLHGSNVWALDYYTLFQPLIYKIFIPYDCIENIKNELQQLGITTSFIFPDLDGLSRELKEIEQNKFYKEYEGRI